MTFVVSHGQLAALESRPHQTWWGAVNRHVRLTPELALTYSQIYRSQPAVRTVVDFLARNISGLSLHTFERISDTDRRRLTASDHALAALLGRPNPTTTPLRFWHSIVADKAIYDRAYAIKTRPGPDAPVGGLRRVSPRRVQPQDGDWLEVSKFRITGDNGKFRDFPREQLVLFDGYSPDTETDSQSPIETLRTILAEEYSAAVYRWQLWRNGARAAGYIERPVEAPEWGDTERKRFRAEWRTTWAGDVGAESGGTPVLEDGMRWVKGAVSPKEAQYVESRKLTREEVATAYHIPPPMVGILDNATYSNITEQHKQLYVDTLGPWLEALQQEVELQLVPEFATIGGPAVYVEFNLAEKLKGSFEEQASALGALVGGRPIMTPDEARGRLNLPAMGGTAAELLDPLNMGDASAAEDADEQVEGEPATEPGTSSARRLRVKAYADDSHRLAHQAMLVDYFERQERSVRSRAGAAKRRGAKQTVEEVLDAERWARELSRDLNGLAPGVVAQVAERTLDTLGAEPDSFVPALTTAFLASQTARVAGSVTTVTSAQVAAALAAEVVDDALAAVFALAKGQRAAQIAQTQVTALSGFGTHEVGKQLADGGEQVVKRWLTGQNPRPSHLRMNGQQVGIDEPFSNGAMWPADTVNLDVDEVAGCNCALEIALEGED